MSSYPTKPVSGPYDICVSANSNLVHIETVHGEQIATVNKGTKEQRIANALFIAEAMNAYAASKTEVA